MSKNMFWMKWLRYSFFLILVSEHNSLAGYKAVIKEPVADMNNSYPVTPDDSPISPGSLSNCKRAHQGLFNEVVTCLEERDDAVRVVFDKVKYNHSDDINKNSFWVSKKYIIPTDSLTDDTLVDVIPASGYAQGSIVVLTYPWKQYSLGTRFKRRAEYDTPTTYGIIHADFVKNKITIDEIPYQDAQVEVVQDDCVHRNLFVKNINSLVDRVALMNRVVAYTWGGSSFTHTYHEDDFYMENNAWQRFGQKTPYSGYDCSEFVMRMAQVAGIDFPWKTTVAIKQGLPELTEGDLLENGDIIWISGHVMVVSDIDNNELIEARGYNRGYGRVQRLLLKDAFEGVMTYDQLIEAHRTQQPLRLRSKAGDVYLETKFSLLKLV